MRINKNKKGISLIVLIITIIIMIVLAGTIILSLVNSGIIGQTKIAVFKNDVASYKSELQMFIADASLKDEITVYGEEIPFDVEEFSRDGNLIQEYITSMSDEDAERFLIIQGQLVYIVDDTLFTDEEMTALDEIGVRPSEYTYAENIGVFDLTTDYTGVNIYVNPIIKETPTVEFEFIADNYIFVVCDDFSIDILNNVGDIDEGYEFPFYTYNISEDMEEDMELDEGMIFKTYGTEYNSDDVLHNHFIGWTNITFSMRNEFFLITINPLLPENLPVFKLSGTIDSGTDLTEMGKYFSLQPYVSVN